MKTVHQSDQPVCCSSFNLPVPETGSTLKREQRTRGFTLVEVLLAVTILALVITAVYSTWSAALTGWKRGSAVADAFQRQRIVMETLNELANSAVFFAGNVNLYQITGQHDESAGDTVSFVTASDVLLPPSEQSMLGMRRVTVGMDRDQHGVPYLAIINTHVLTDEQGAAQAQRHVLSAEVNGFSVRYRDARDGTWREEWTEVNTVPGALEFTVSFFDPTGNAPTIVVTRAVELPAAVFAMQNVGNPQNLQNTSGSSTNTVIRRSIQGGSSMFTTPTGSGTGGGR
jgi:prepilin-type N-terminal cleavage/methylation domain-containing protein